MRFRMQDLMMDVGPGIELANERCTCAQSANPGGRRPPHERERSPKPEAPSPRSPREAPGGGRGRPEDAPYEAAGAAALAALRMQLQHNLGAGA